MGKYAKGILRWIISKMNITAQRTATLSFLRVPLRRQMRTENPPTAGIRVFSKKPSLPCAVFLPNCFQTKKEQTNQCIQNRITKIIPVQNALRRTKRMHRREFLRRISMGEYKYWATAQQQLVWLWQERWIMPITEYIQW